MRLDSEFTRKDHISGIATTIRRGTLLAAVAAAGLDNQERRFRLARAVSAVLREAMRSGRSGYQLPFRDDTGVQLLTPSGLLVCWFGVAHECAGWTTLVLDLRADLSDTDESCQA